MKGNANMSPATHTMKSPLKAHVCGNNSFQKVDLSVCVSGLARINEGEAGC